MSKGNSPNEDFKTDDNEFIKLEEGRDEYFKDEKSVENNLDTDISENNLIKSEAAKSNCISLSQNGIKSVIVDVNENSKNINEFDQKMIGKEKLATPEVKTITKNVKDNKTNKSSDLNEKDKTKVEVSNGSEVSGTKVEFTKRKMEIGEFNLFVQNQPSIVQNQIIYLKFDATHMLDSIINEIKDAEFSHVHQLSEDRRKFVDDELLNLDTSTDILDVISLQLFRLESDVWEITSLKEYNEKDDISVKEILGTIIDFYKHYTIAFEKVMEYYKVLGNREKLTLDKSFGEKCKRAANALKIIFKLSLTIRLRVIDDTENSIK